MPAEEDRSSLFDLLGHETRMAILQVLLESDRTGETSLSFSTLKSRAGVTDTGRFNYHLGELQETLVVQTEAGYRLSRFAQRILRPMATGFYDPEFAIEPLPIPGSCPECDASLEVTLSENILQVRCEAGHVTNHGLVASPGLIEEHEPADARRAIGLLTTQATELGTAGICPVCHGHTTGTIEEYEPRDAYIFRAPCRICGNDFMTPVGGCIETHPRVVKLYDTHAVDIRQVIPWKFPFRRIGHEELISTTPFRIRIRVGAELPGVSLDVTLDGSGRVDTIDEIPE